MFRPFLPRERSAARWSGLALAALGLFFITVGAILGGHNPFARWILSEMITPVKVLPLFSLGIASALIGVGTMALAQILFVVGIASGSLMGDALLPLLDKIPGATTHLSLTGPISYGAAGAALVIGARWRRFMVPLAAAITGAVTGLGIRFTAPGFHEPAYTWMSILIVFWIVLAVSLCAWGFWREWFVVFSRVLGSWMLAIGLLYGGSLLMPKKAPPPAAALSSTPKPGNEGPNPGLLVPDQQVPFTGGERLRQP